MMSDEGRRWAGLAGVVVFLAVAGGAIYWLGAILAPFVAAFMVAYVLSPIVDLGERQRLPRWAIIVGVYLIMLGGVVIGLIFLIPVLIEEIGALRENIQHFAELILTGSGDIQKWVQGRFPELSQTLFGDANLGNQLGETIRSAASEVLDRVPDMIQGFFSNLLSVISYFVVVPFVAFFILKDGRNIKRSFIALVPNRYFEMTLSLISRIDNAVGGYVGGQITESFVVGLLAVIGLKIVGLEYAVIVGTVAGLTNLIPYVGPASGAIIGSIVAVVTGKSIMWVLAVFGIVQIVDNIFLQPFILGRSVNMHPLAVFAVVLIAGSLGGLAAMIIAVPVTNIVVVIISTLRENFRHYQI